MFTSLRNFKGNARGCVYTEPLNGIPYHLYAPYISIFMIALGVSDSQIGLIVSISWFFQLFTALFSGVITDKLGRRRTTLIFDIISWTIPVIVSAVAQNFWFFLGAGIINSFYRITQNSWMCLMVEDSDPDQLINIFSWIYIAGLLSAFFAPFAGLMIRSYSLIPTMRILYLFAAISFAIKEILTYQMTDETLQGFARMQATKGTSLLASLSEYKGVLREIMHTPRTLYTTGIMVIMSISMMINGTFWSVIVTEKLKIPAQNIAIFPFEKSVVMLLFFFIVIPRMRAMQFKIPLVLGFAGFGISQILLVIAPINGYSFLLLSVLLEACSLATVSPLVDQMTVLTIDPIERARIQSILYVGIILITSPFGWIAGALSGLDKSLPFVLNIGLFLVGGILAYLAGKTSSNTTRDSSIPDIA
ncbi:MAG: MFS transporter [Anaerolineaceae bacterium]|nr:MFS transporter [Anaerolineaceae bacterium]